MEWVMLRPIIYKAARATWLQALLGLGEMLDEATVNVLVRHTQRMPTPRYLVRTERLRNRDCQGAHSQ